MKYAQSSLMNRQWNELAEALEHIQREAMTVAALVASANDAAWHNLEEPASVSTGGIERREQVSALLRLGSERFQALLHAIDAAFERIAARAASHEKLTRESNADAIVEAALDEAVRLLDRAGTAPIVLLFDEEERSRLGKEPHAHLASLVERARVLLGERTVTEAGECFRVLGEALALAHLLGEGSKARPWTSRYVEPMHYDEHGQRLVPVEETEEAKLSTLLAEESNAKAKPARPKKRDQT